MYISCHYCTVLMCLIIILTATLSSQSINLALWHASLQTTWGHLWQILPVVPPLGTQHWLISFVSALRVDPIKSDINESRQNYQTRSYQLHYFILHTRTFIPLELRYYYFHSMGIITLLITHLFDPLYTITLYLNVNFTCH